MDAEDKKKDEVEETLRDDLKEENKDLKEANELREMEERQFADDNIEPAPNSMWGQSGTWWVLGIAAILIIFLVIWVCFFYGPN